MKYGRAVHIVTRRHLSEASAQYPDAAKEIQAWTAIVEAVRWHSFEEARQMFKDADSVEGYVIFNIRGNRYRLVTVIHCEDNEAKTNERARLRPLFLDAQRVRQPQQNG